MKTLALRIYLTVVAALLVFALVSGWLAQRNLEHERSQVQSMAAWNERAAAWAELIENSLPPATAPVDEQSRIFLDWSERLRMPMALDDPLGRRIATSILLQERLRLQPELRDRMQRSILSDGRTMWVLRAWVIRGKGPQTIMGPMREGDAPPGVPPPPPPG